MKSGVAEMARLTGKVALITGAAGGQGTAEAELFVRERALLVLTDIDEAAGQSLARRLEAESGQVLFLKQDVADEASWGETVSAALAHFGKLHILVNNAGTIARQGIVDTTVEAWNRTLAVNLTGAMLGMKHCAPAIRDSGGGSIINISSTAGLTAHDDAAYTASKWGLRGLTKTAVLQFSQWNIRVNSIHPGQIADTGFYRNAGEAFAHAARTAIPMHRQGTPKECAELVLFLASDESSFISGAEIAIDGGYIAAGTANLRNRVREDFATGRN
jgi:3alpha(or 20beta)-hydroxysteroid dehydrogenase